MIRQQHCPFLALREPLGGLKGLGYMEGVCVCVCVCVCGLDETEREIKGVRGV